MPTLLNRGRCTASPGCAEPRVPGETRCARHLAEAEAARGSSANRGYAGPRWRGARRTVLRRDPLCTCQATDCHLELDGRCVQVSTVADHWPRSRKELVAAGVRDPDDPTLLRGLCRSCHSKETSRHQPGGWNQR